MSAPAPGYSYPITALLFVLGGAVTAVFSGSLVRLARHVGWDEVIIVGMVIPSFTWIVQLSASAVLLEPAAQRRYWNDLGWICLWGSVALLPAGILNLVLPDPPLWMSPVNVLLSVALMAADLFRRCQAAGLSRAWPISWCATITLNMTLFVTASRGWC